MSYGRRILRSCMERAEVDYLKARRTAFIEPVILIDARNQEERRRRIAPASDPDGLPMAHVAIKIASRSMIAREVGALSAPAGAAIAAEDPKSPFTVVVLTEGPDGRGIVEVFDMPEPR